MVGAQKSFLVYYALFESENASLVAIEEVGIQ